MVHLEPLRDAVCLLGGDGMNDKYREDWKHPDQSFRVWCSAEWWIYESTPRKVRSDCQTKAEHDALMAKPTGTEPWEYPGKAWRVRHKHGTFYGCHADGREVFKCGYGKDCPSLPLDKPQSKEEWDAMHGPTPKHGDMVWVRSDSDSQWQKKRFLAIVNGECWCYEIGNLREAMSWPEWKPIEPEMSVDDMKRRARLGT